MKYNPGERYKFNSIEELLACADKTVSALQKMFPHIEAVEIKVKVLEYLLKSSSLG